MALSQTQFYLLFNHNLPSVSVYLIALYFTRCISLRGHLSSLTFFFSFFFFSLSDYFISAVATFMRFLLPPLNSSKCKSADKKSFLLTKLAVYDWSDWLTAILLFTWSSTNNWARRKEQEHLRTHVDTCARKDWRYVYYCSHCLTVCLQVCALALCLLMFVCANESARFTVREGESQWIK